MYVVGTYKEFKKALKNKTVSDKVKQAIKAYLETGGIIKIRKSGKLKVLYPSKNILKKSLEKTEKKEKYLDTQIAFWKKEGDKMTANEMFTNFKKITNVNYWQHLAQLATNQEYRKSFDIVDLPMDMMHEGRYKNEPVSCSMHESFTVSSENNRQSYVFRRGSRIVWVDNAPAGMAAEIAAQAMAVWKVQPGREAVIHPVPFM